MFITASALIPTVTIVDVDLPTLITAISVLVTAVSTAFVVIYKQIKAVHVMVNSNNTELVAEQARLNGRVGRLLLSLGLAEADDPDPAGDPDDPAGPRLG